MDVPFHFGILPHLNASFVLFEEMNRGKARTELVLQSVEDGDLIACYGRTSGEDITRRLAARQLQNVTVIVFREEDFIDNPHWMAKIETRISRAKGRASMIHIDHTLVYKIVEVGLREMSHTFAYFVGMVGAENQQAIYLRADSCRLTHAYPIERGE